MRQIKIPIAKPWFSEEEANAAAEVVKSEWLISGPKVEQFEKKFAELQNVKHAVAVNSGSSALLIMQQSLGIKQGDEVVVPDMTFVSTATSCMYLGAKPTFADITLTDYGIDPLDIKKCITDKTKVILPVHYAGQTATIDEIKEIADENNLILLEDAAESHLAEYKNVKCGNFGKATIFSFTPTKPMTTGEGGMIVTNDKEMADKCRLIRNYCDIDKFNWQSLGFNFRMPEIMGAIGLIQLKKLKKAIEIRKNIAKRYTEEFNKIDSLITPFVRSEKDHNFQLYTLRLNNAKISRDNLIQELAKKGISSRLYYPALHKQTVFNNIINRSEFKNTLEFEKTAICLPIYPSLKEEEINYIIQSIKGILE